jgi:molybdate transport system substrate-binding protein
VKKSIAFLFWTSLIGCVVTFSIQAAMPQDAQARSDEAVKTRVEAALKGNSDLGGAEIAVAVDQGIVTLSGRVSSERLRGGTYPGADLKQNLGAIVRMVPGVKDVRFSLEMDADGAGTKAPGVEVTLIAPGGMKCSLDKMTPDFERRVGHPVKVTIAAGGAIHQQVVRGDSFDVPIVQLPYQDVIASGNVVASSETPLASVAVVVIVRKDDPKPDISSADKVRQVLLAAKAISYPDGAGGRGAAAGVSIDQTFQKLGITDQMTAKTKRVAGASLLQLLEKGDADIALTYASEVNDPDVNVVGPLPQDVSTPTALVAFVSAHTKSPDGAKALLSYLSSRDAGAIYKACGMQPGR